MQSISRRLYLQLAFLLMVNLVYCSQKFQNEVLATFNHTDLHCWDYASLHLLRFRKFKTVKTTNELWDFMQGLYEKRNKNPWFENAYFSLLFDFQKMYVDCLLGKEHGMGKRHVESTK